MPPGKKKLEWTTPAEMAAKAGMATAEAPAVSARKGPEDYGDDDLLMVAPHRSTYWPFAEMNFPVRGGPGTVVYAKDPLLKCKDRDGREHDQYDRLIPAPAGAQVTPYSNPLAKAVYAELGYTRNVHRAEGAPDDSPKGRRAAEIRRRVAAATGKKPASPMDRQPSSDDMAVPPVIPPPKATAGSDSEHEGPGDKGLGE